jgi:hypothetical protein
LIQAAAVACNTWVCVCVVCATVCICVWLCAAVCGCVRLSAAVCILQCEPGQYCVAGKRHPCGPGTYGSTYGLKVPFCTAPCPAGECLRLRSIWP